MEREDFKRILKEEGIPYRVEGGSLVVGRGKWRLCLVVRSIPSDVKFINDGDIELNFIEKIPPGVEFKGASIYLRNVRSISPSVRFTNRYSTVLCPLLGSRFHENGGILSPPFPFAADGIRNWRILNRMISLGIFDRTL